MKFHKGSLLSRTFAYSFESTFRLAAAAIVGVIVARYLGPSGLGLLSYVAAVFGILAPISSLGMQRILVREFSTNDDWEDTLAGALRLQVPVGLAVAILAVLISISTRGFGWDVTLIALAMFPLPLLTLSEAFRALLEARNRTGRIVWTGVLAISVSAGLKLLAAASARPIWVFAALTALEAALVALGLGMGVHWPTFRHRLFRMSDKTQGRKLLAESWPLLLSGVAVSLYLRADVVMLGLLSTDEAAGIYVAAARLSEVWYFIPVAALAAVGPALARLFASGDDLEYNRLTQRFMTGAFALSLIAVALVLGLGDQAIAFLYGAKFSGAAAVLKVHIFSAPFVFLGVATTQWLIDRSLTGFILARSVAGAVVNILLNLVLIPALGSTGAAVATLVSYAVSGLIMTGLIKATRPLLKIQLRALRLAWR